MVTSRGRVASRLVHTVSVLHNNKKLMGDLWGEFRETNHPVLSESDFLFHSHDPKLVESTFLIPSQVKGKKEDVVLKEEELTVKHGIVEHTIKLERYRKQLHFLLGTAVHIISDSSQEHATPKLADAPEFPTCVDCHKKASEDENIDLYDRNFVRGIGLAPAKISPATCAQLLKRSMAQICLHQGYQDCSSSALDSLVGACQEFYTKFLGQLRLNVDSEAMNNHSGFQDSLHRTLAQLGQGSLSDLIENYQLTTVCRHDKLLSTCRQLEGAYNHIKSTGELPDSIANMLPLLPPREAPSSVLSLAEDGDEKTEHSGGAMGQEEAMGEDDDAQKLLELAGLSGFDITIEGEQDEEHKAGLTRAPPPAEPPRAKAKSKAKGKTAAATAKRRKKH